MTQRELNKRIGVSILSQEFYYRYRNPNHIDASIVGVHKGWRLFPDSTDGSAFCSALQRLYDDEAIEILSVPAYEYITGFNFRRMTKAVFEELYNIVDGLDQEIGS